MKRAFFLLLTTLLLAVAFYVAVANIRCGHCRGLSDRIFFTVFLMDDATRFSPGYSENAFNKIRGGMSKADVVNLLGEPLKKESDGGSNYSEIWRFSQAPTNRNYWFRIVLFDRDGKVVETEGEYSVD